MGKSSLGLLSFVLVSSMGWTARAGIVSLASPAAFNAPTVEHFQGTQAYTGAYDFGTGMTYLNLVSQSDLINLAGTYGLGQSGSAVGGRGGAADRYFGAGSSPTTIKLSFAGGVSGFGFYGAEAFNSGSALQNGSLSLEFYDVSDGLIETVTVATPPPFSWTPFYGFGSDVAIGSVVFRDAAYMVMDDVHFGAATLPEPGMLALGPTFLAAGLRRWRN
jgi:hypothetical protein